MDFLHGFYGPFSEDLDKARKAIKEATQEAASDSTNEPCDVCGKPMIVKLGRFGAFLSCTGYPDCKNSKDLPSADDSG